MKKTFLISAAVFLIGIFAVSQTAFAAGFRLPESSASAMGMSSAFVGQADDPSAVWYNPAGITQLDGTRISAGVVTIYPIMKHETIIGTTDVSERTTHFPFHLYGTHKLNDQIYIGLGINNPFGLSTDWDETSVTRNISTFTKVVTANVNPNIAYKINGNLSVALGVDYMKLRATLESILPSSGNPNFRLSGDGEGWGANAAVYYRATDTVNLGLSYRSRIEVDIDGTADVAEGAISNPATTSITLPDILQVGASYKASNDLILNADIEYTWWSTYDRLVITSDTILALTTLNPLVPDTDTQTEEKQWDNAWCLRLGGEYKLSEHWKLRAGYLYDQNPVPEERFETRVPDSDRQGVSLGTGYTSGNLTIDAAYMYLRFNKRTISDSLQDGASQVLNGTYKTQAHLAGLTIGYKF